MIKSYLISKVLNKRKIKIKASNNLWNKNDQIFTLYIVKKSCPWILYLDVFSNSSFFVFLNKRIYLSTSHTVKEVLLWDKTSHETVNDESTTSRRRIIGKERRQRIAIDHETGTSSLELLLSEETRHLHAVDAGALGSRLDHELEVVVGKALDQAVREARVCQIVLKRVYGAFIREVDLSHVRFVRVQVHFAQLLNQIFTACFTARVTYL